MRPNLIDFSVQIPNLIHLSLLGITAQNLFITNRNKLVDFA